MLYQYIRLMEGADERKAAMATIDRERYHYTESGLENIYLVNGFEHIETPRGIAVKITDIKGLHKAIGMIIARERKNLSGREFRFLRHEINMTQQNLANLLGMDIQSVGRWERGEGAIPGPAQGLIRLLFEEKSTGNRAISEPLERLAELDEQANAEDEELSFDPSDGWTSVAVVAA
jgi:putative transcriptional regulator